MYVCVYVYVYLYMYVYNRPIGSPPYAYKLCIYIYDMFIYIYMYVYPVGSRPGHGLTQILSRVP